MYKSAYQTKAVSFEDLARAYTKEGFKKIPTGRGVPANLIRDILGANPDIGKEVASGRGVFFPEQFGMWTNGEDYVEQLDWSVRSPRQETKDPYIKVVEFVPGRTSGIVERILERELQIQYITYSLSRGPISSASAQCIEDLALMKGRDPEQLFDQYIDTFLSCWIDVIATPKTVKPKYWRDEVYKVPMRAV